MQENRQVGDQGDALDDLDHQDCQQRRQQTAFSMQLLAQRCPRAMKPAHAAPVGWEREHQQCGCQEAADHQPGHALLAHQRDECADDQGTDETPGLAADHPDAHAKPQLRAGDIAGHHRPHSMHARGADACNRQQDCQAEVARRNPQHCLLYTSDAADDLLCVDLGGRRIIKKKKTEY